MAQLARPEEKTTQQWHEALAALVEKRPALETVLKPFAAVLKERSAMIADLKPRIPFLDTSRAADPVAGGTPVMAWVGFEVLKDSLTQALVGLAAVLKDIFQQQSEDFSAIETAARQGRYDAAGLATAYLEGDFSIFQTASHGTGHSAESLVFAFSWALGAALNAARSTWAQPETFDSWSKGFCPFCGSLPAVSFLSRPEASHSEYPSGGGQRYLQCALCSHQWRMERHRCPACDATEKGSLVYYHESGNSGERIDACQNCNSYLPCIDLRKTRLPVSMELAALGMVHLDFLAREKGYRPMAFTPWNRVETPEQAH